MNASTARLIQCAKKAALYVLLLCWTIVCLYPFVWMLSATLRPEPEIGRLNPVPSKLTLESYRLVFTKIPIARAFANSLFVSLSATAGVLLFTSMTGYALSRLHFRGRDGIFALVLFTMTLPFQITLIPTYVLMVKLGWNDTYYALIVPYMINAFAIVVFAQYFKSVPQDLLDAARIDGCSDLSILFRVMWPLSVPALITVAILTFMNIWNEVLWPIIVIRKWELMTMPQLVALFAVGGKAEGLLGVRLAAAALLALPIVVAYAFFQRYFIASMATTGLKS
ncbi:MAG: carbohydrate ABC transporter permease [candidate division KSB1 bacterium]|nr:carbohydrate ABC transporter permease [candidate division KSB1 bacterium]MDZ7386616.1 carbohydrate ABC transporter permease [candidate division KSB1 bacterium]MDZ7412802.1 carbohydrate ABC transporter permease [candidate division KSB1 bacterium]